MEIGFMAVASKSIKINVTFYWFCDTIIPWMRLFVFCFLYFGSVSFYCFLSNANIEWEMQHKHQHSIDVNCWN